MNGMLYACNGDYVTLTKGSVCAEAAKHRQVFLHFQFDAFWRISLVGKISSIDMQKECLILHAFFRGGLVLFSCVGQAVGAHVV